MRLDMTVSLGNVLTIAGYVVTVFVAYAAIRERLVRIETQLDPITEWWNKRRMIVRGGADEQ